MSAARVSLADGRAAEQGRDGKGTFAFDRLAARYDEVWTNSLVGRAQRELVWQHVDALFQNGDRILDIGCGTGEDAAHFAQRGAKVHAVDPSPAMIAIARERGGFTTEVRGAEDLAQLRLAAPAQASVYDGAASNFGALNCAADLPSVARELANLVRPGGRIAICTIGRFCLWETLYYSARFQFGKAFRRLKGSAPSSLGITIQYPTVAGLAAAFAPGFEIERWTGIGLLVPPSYVSLPRRAVRLLAAVDRALARLPILRGLADHRLLIFVRK